MSRRALPHEALEDLLKKLQNQGLKRVWLDGGSALVDTFERAGCIDEYMISVVPLLLGDGVPLFMSGRRPQGLTLVGSKSYRSGLVQLHYRTDTTNR